MQVVTLHSPQRRWVTVQRPDDGRGQRLVILAGWGQRPAEVFRAALRTWSLARCLRSRGLGLPVPLPELPDGP